MKFQVILLAFVLLAPIIVYGQNAGRILDDVAEDSDSVDDTAEMDQEEDTQEEEGDAIDEEDGEDDEEEFIEDELGQREQEELEQEAAGEEFEDAPEGDETGDLDAGTIEELTEHGSEEADIVRDEDGVIEGVAAAGKEPEPAADEVEQLTELIEEFEEKMSKKQIEEYEKSLSEADLDALTAEERRQLDAMPDAADRPEAPGGDVPAAADDATDDGKIKAAQLPEGETVLTKDSGPLTPTGQKRGGSDLPMEALSKTAEREKLRLIRKLARLRAQQQGWNGTLKVDSSQYTEEEDIKEYERVRAKAREIIKRQRTKREYSLGKKQLTATVRIDPMITIKAGKFRLGVNDPSSTTGEYPVRNIVVKPFKMDRFPITNADFELFKSKKKRYTTEAQKTGYSWVFYTHMLRNSTRMEKMQQEGEPWWFAVKDTTWDKPYGPHSSLRNLSSHPVVHVSYHDAAAFCMWAGKRLPTEYEWEYACRAGRNGIRYPWGDRFERNRTNLWQGLFPMENKKADGYDGIAPVTAYRAQNEYGLYDMCGNVWEWTSTQWYMPRRRRNDPAHEEDPTAPKRYVVRGGSFVDSRDGTINYEARCGNRRPMPLHYTGENVGFRCAETIKMDPERYRRMMEQPERRKKKKDKARKKKQPKVHKFKDQWSYKMKTMLEDIMEGGKDSESSVMEKLRKMKSRQRHEL